MTYEQATSVLQAIEALIDAKIKKLKAELNRSPGDSFCYYDDFADERRKLILALEGELS